MGLRHLRLLEFLERAVDIYTGRAEQRQLAMRLAMIGLRISANRLEFQAAPLGGPEIHQKLVAMTGRYQECLDDPIVFGFAARIKEMVQFEQTNGLSHSGQVYIGNPSFMAMMFRTVDEMTGWA